MLREDIEDMKRNVESIHKDVVEENTFAMHLLRELKQSAKRNFIAFIITLVALVGTNIAWLIYENSFETIFETETTTVDGGNGMATYLENSIAGDIINGENN